MQSTKVHMIHGVDLTGRTESLGLSAKVEKCVLCGVDSCHLGQSGRISRKTSQGSPGGDQQLEKSEWSFQTKNKRATKGAQMWRNWRGLWESIRREQTKAMTEGRTEMEDDLMPYRSCRLIKDSLVRWDLRWVDYLRVVQSMSTCFEQWYCIMYCMVVNIVNLIGSVSPRRQTSEHIHEGVSRLVNWVN